MTRPTVLCVDSDASTRERTVSALRDGVADATLISSPTIADANEILTNRSVDCVVTDYTLSDGTGLELIGTVRETAPDAACILFADVPLEEIDTTAFGEVVAEYLPKNDPNVRDELVDLVRHSLGFRSQTAYPLPENEDARVAALKGYATGPDALVDSLDQLTELATELFDLNSAAVGIIDAHHERFLSCHGASFAPMDREDTICTYTILEDEITVIENVADDPRFSENERLSAADIRFYAGAPLVTSDGQAIGTFCVHHDEPRTLSERNRELLLSLADQAMTHLELRRRLREANGGETNE